MRRREFVKLFCSGFAAGYAWPRSAKAQSPAMPLVGFLSSGAPGPFAEVTDAFNRGLSDAGFVAGKTATIEYRWASGQYDRLPALAEELVQRRAAVIVVAGGAVTALAAKAATSTIPIVFIMGDDPVRTGLVASLNRPGGNVTGVTLIISELISKRFEVLANLAPNATIIALLVNPTNPNSAADVRDAQAAARARGRQLVVVDASTTGEIDQAYESLTRQGARAVILGTDIFFTVQRAQIVALSLRYRIPTIHQWRDFVVDGGLVSYGTSHTEPYRQAADYAARILKGEKPADLPVTQPTKFELVINLRTAKALGIEVPSTLLAIADEVIE